MADAIGGPDEAARLWRVNRTVHEMVKDRVRMILHKDDCYGFRLTLYGQGFQVSDEEIEMDLATFKATYANGGGSVESVIIPLQGGFLINDDLSDSLTQS